MNPIILISASTAGLSFSLILLFPSITLNIYRILSIAGICTSIFTTIKFQWDSRRNEFLFSLIMLSFYLNFLIIINRSALEVLDFDHELAFCEGAFYSLLLVLLKQNRYIILICFILVSLNPIRFVNFVLSTGYILYLFKTQSWHKRLNQLQTGKGSSFVVLILYTLAFLPQYSTAIRIILMECWGVFCLPSLENRERKLERKRISEEEERISLKESQN